VGDQIVAFQHEDEAVAGAAFAVIHPLKVIAGTVIRPRGD
jgi:hypothetical protein